MPDDPPKPNTDQTLIGLPALVDEDPPAATGEQPAALSDKTVIGLQPIRDEDLPPESDEPAPESFDAGATGEQTAHPAATGDHAVSNDETEPEQSAVATRMREAIGNDVTEERKRPADQTIAQARHALIEDESIPPIADQHTVLKPAREIFDPQEEIRTEPKRALGKPDDATLPPSRQRPAALVASGEDTLPRPQKVELQKTTAPAGATRRENTGGKEFKRRGPPSQRVDEPMSTGTKRVLLGLGALVAAVVIGGFCLALLRAGAPVPPSVVELPVPTSTLVPPPKEAKDLVEKPSAAGTAGNPAPSPGPAVPTTPVAAAPTAGVDAGVVAVPGSKMPTGQIRFMVTPDSNVLLDGHDLGVTPLMATLPAGTANITIENKKLGFRRSVPVEVVAYEQHNVELKFNPGFAEIVAPPDAVIFVDGKPPAGRNVQLWEGTHKIEAVIGAQRVTKTVEIIPGQTITVEMSE